MFSALLFVAGGSKPELNMNILAGLCATLSPRLYDRAQTISATGSEPPERTLLHTFL